MVSNRRVFDITYPILLTLIAQNIINVTDTAFLGRVSEVALGASAIAGVFYIAMFMLGFGFSQGVQIMIARRNGEKNYAAIGQIFNGGLIFNLLLAASVFLLTYLFAPRLMKTLVSSNDIYQATNEYLYWRIGGFFFSFLNVVFRAFFVGITRTKVLTISAIITAVVNIFMDYSLIFGNFGLPQLGIAGAAIASVVAEFVTLFYMLIITLRQKDRKELGLFVFKNVNRKIIHSVLKLSIFIMFQYFVSISTWLMFFVFIEKLGERPLAVTNIGRSLYTLLMIPGSALAITVSTLVSNIIGADEKEQVMIFLNKILRLTIITVLPFTIISYFYPQLLATIYTDNAELISASLPTLRVIAFAMLFCAVGHIILSAVSGTGNTRTTFIMELITLFFYISYTYITAIILKTSVEIVWFSEFIYWGILAILGYTYMISGKWKNKEI